MLRDLAVRRVRLDSLVEEPLNARLHDARNLAGIASSLQNFGQREPLVVRDGVVIGGNGRLRAMRELGWEECWVTDHSDLTPGQARALGVVLNRTAEVGTSWHPEKLALAIEQVKLECPEVVLDFKPVELAAIMPKPEVVEDEAPEPQAEVFAQRGDIICLGKHRVMCGDSTIAEDVEALLGDVKPGLMVTDPPYGVKLDPAWRDKAGLNSMGKAGGGGAAYLETSDGDTEARWDAVWALVPSCEVAYVWCADARLPEVVAALGDAGLMMRQLLVWDKMMLTRTRTHYWMSHEQCIYAVRKGGTAGWVGKPGQSSIIRAPSPKHIMAGSEEENEPHPAQKPVACMAVPISNHSHAHVYEPFMGSGTTLIAGDQMGKTVLGMEKSPEFIDVIVRRYLAHCVKTGRAPEVTGWRGSE